MDPPLFSEGSFSTSNPSLAEIWPFNGGGGGGGAIADANGLLGLRIAGGGGGGFGLGLMGGFVDGPMNRDGSIEESTVTDQSGSHGGAGGRKRRDMGSEDESSKLVSTTTASGNELETIGKRMRTSGSNEHTCGSKHGGEASSNGGGKPSEKNNQSNEPPKDYIHVRARRGQATDSHSLAERARREKISERMKILQDLVPGCNKVIGKALVLDEIINYIQSLQRQVEFLSMKLEAVNSGINPVISGFPPKDLGPISFDATGILYGPQAAREFESGRHPDWLHMHLGGAGGGGFERTA